MLHNSRLNSISYIVGGCFDHGLGITFDILIYSYHYAFDIGIFHVQTISSFQFLKLLEIFSSKTVILNI